MISNNPTFGSRLETFLERMLQALRYEIEYGLEEAVEVE